MRKDNNDGDNNLFLMFLFSTFLVFLALVLIISILVNVAFKYLFLYMVAATGMFLTVLILIGSLLEKEELAGITVKQLKTN